MCVNAVHPLQLKYPSWASISKDHLLFHLSSSLSKMNFLAAMLLLLLLLLFFGTNCNLLKWLSIVKDSFWISYKSLLLSQSGKSPSWQSLRSNRHKDNRYSSRSQGLLATSKFLPLNERICCQNQLSITNKGRWAQLRIVASPSSVNLELLFSLTLFIIVETQPPLGLLLMRRIQCVMAVLALHWHWGCDNQKRSVDMKEFPSGIALDHAMKDCTHSAVMVD